MRRAGLSLGGGSEAAKVQALCHEFDRAEALREQVEAAGGGLLVRLVEVRPGEDADELADLFTLVRAVRRSQPSRRRDGEFARGSDGVPLGDWRAFVVWAVHGARPERAAVHLQRAVRAADVIDGSLPSDDPASWFARPRIWWAGAPHRMAALFLDAAVELPVLAFDPFPPGEVRPERLFRWQAVRPDGQRVEVL